VLVTKVGRLLLDRVTAQRLTGDVGILDDLQNEAGPDENERGLMEVAD